MDTKKFNNYLHMFEQEIALNSVDVDNFGRVELVPVRNGKLARTPFGRIMGGRIHSDNNVVIDYYGLFKKSEGYYKKMYMLRGHQVKMVEAKVIHFASIRIEDVASLSTDLVTEFPAFKKELLRNRGF